METDSAEGKPSTHMSMSPAEDLGMAEEKYQSSEEMLADSLKKTRADLDKKDV